LIILGFALLILVNLSPCPVRAVLYANLVVPIS